MTQAHRVDWPTLITDLIHAGLKMGAIAERAGVARPTVIAYHQHGNAPRYETGERLIEVWCATTGRVRADVPRIASEAVIERVTMLTGS